MIYVKIGAFAAMVLLILFDAIDAIIASSFGKPSDNNESMDCIYVRSRLDENAIQIKTCVHRKGAEYNSCPANCRHKRVANPSEYRSPQVLLVFRNVVSALVPLLVFIMTYFVEE